MAESFKYHVTCVDTQSKKVVSVSSKSDIYETIKMKFGISDEFILQMPYDDDWVDVDDVDDMQNGGKLQFCQRKAVQGNAATFKETARVSSASGSLPNMRQRHTDVAGVLYPSSSTAVKSQKPETSRTPISSADIRRQKINMLVLGESGAGKSTTINGLANYFSYATLAEAEEGGIITVIPMEFKYRNPNTMKEETVEIGKTDQNFTNEQHKAGESATKLPRVYQFDLGDTEINVIDTPGFLDTGDKDRENIKHIVTFLASFETLNAICILLKAGTNRLSPHFEVAFTQLLRSLHESACNNVVFCQTHSNASGFELRDNYDVLKAFLDCDGHGSILKQIRLTGDTVYCIDNEAVIYLAKRSKSGSAIPRTHYAQMGWDMSCDALRKLVKYVMTLKPHMVDDTMSLNEARKTIGCLSTPLIEIAELYYPNVRELQKAKDDIGKCHSSKDVGGVVYVTMLEIKVEKFSYTNAYCEAQSCVKYLDGRMVYGEACCTRCDAPARWLCDAMSWSYNCRKCGHNYSDHVWRQSLTHVVEKGPFAYNTKQLEDKLQQLNDEQKTLIKTCAELTLFLEQHALCRDRDSGSEFIKSIESKIAEIESKLVDEKSKEKLGILTEILKEIKEQVRQLRGKTTYTAKDVRTKIDKLKMLPNSGSKIAEADIELKPSKISSELIPVKCSSDFFKQK